MKPVKGDLGMSGARGDLRLEVGGEEVGLFFSNRSLAEFEAQAGRSAWVLVDLFAKGMLPGINDLVGLMRAGMEGWRLANEPNRRSLTLDDAFGVLDQVGYVAAASLVMPAVSEVLFFTPVKEKP